MPWLRRIVCLLPLLAVIALCGSCNGFFVSGSSIQSIAVTPSAVILKVATSSAAGDTFDLSSSATTVGGTTTDDTTTATWTSNPNSVATVSSSGVITVVGTTAGNTAVITATDGGASSSCNVLTYTGSIPSSLNVVLPNGVTSTVGPGTFKLNATATLNGNANTNISSYVTWSSSATTQATVDSNGNVTVLSTATPGVTFIIYATANISGTSVQGTNTFTVS